MSLVLLLNRWMPGAKCPARQPSEGLMRISPDSARASIASANIEVLARLEVERQAHRFGHDD